MKLVEIVGPCSKWIDGKGWVTQIPEHLLFAKGYVNLLEIMSENNKNSNTNLNTNENLINTCPYCENYKEKEKLNERRRHSKNKKC